MCDALDRIEKRGIEKGIEKGEWKANIETALRMLKAKFQPEQIAELTGLPLSKVNELKNSLFA